MSGSGTRSTPIVYSKTTLPKQKAKQLLKFPQGGSLEPKRFKRHFGDFVAVDKVTRPGGRNIPFRAGAQNILPFSQQNKEESRQALLFES
ncbi:MAG: hypothetical protein IIT35_05800 [Oscillospiraceae bacterium]|nr:hypothetical protein [Oscillospiraceae bacterium]